MADQPEPEPYVYPDWELAHRRTEAAAAREQTMYQLRHVEQQEGRVQAESDGAICDRRYVLPEVSCR